MRFLLGLCLLIGCATTTPQQLELEALRKTTTAAEAHVMTYSVTHFSVALDVAEKVGANLGEFKAAVDDRNKGLVSFSSMIRSTRAAIDAVEAQLRAGVVDTAAAFEGLRLSVRAVVKIANGLGAAIAGP